MRSIVFKDMEIKLPGTEDKKQQYFDNLLARVRDIRASERTPRQKVADIISLATDYNKEDAIPLLALQTDYNLLSAKRNKSFLERLKDIPKIAAVF